MAVDPDGSVLNAAFQQCRALLQQRASSTMGLAVDSKNHLDGIVRKVFGDSMVRALERDNRLELKGITTLLLTEKIRIRKLKGPVLAVLVDAQKLERIVSCAGVTDVVYVPSAAAELAVYLAAYPSSVELPLPSTA